MDSLNGEERLLQVRFPDAVPILKRRLKIAFKEINGAEEIVRVFVVGMDAQGTTQPGGRGRIFLLLERHAGKFYWETLVSRRKPPTGGKGLSPWR